MLFLECLCSLFGSFNTIFVELAPDFKFRRFYVVKNYKSIDFKTVSR